MNNILASQPKYKIGDSINLTIDFLAKDNKDYVKTLSENGTIIGCWCDPEAVSSARNEWYYKIRCGRTDFVRKEYEISI